MKFYSQMVNFVLTDSFYVHMDVWLTLVNQYQKKKHGAIK